MDDLPPGPLLLAADRVVDGAGGPVLHDGAVLVERARIVAVGRAAEFGAMEVTRRSHPGATLLPGLVDSHVHLELAAGPDHASTLDAWHRDRATGQLGLRALGTARAALLAGITTIRDCGATLGIIAVRDALAADGPGPRLLVTGPPVTTRGGHCHWFGGEAETPDELRALVARLCDAGVDAIKVMATGGVMTAASDPTVRQYELPSLRIVVDEAHRRGRPVVAHANATPGVADGFEAGADTIDHLGWLDRDGAIRPDPGLIASLGSARQVCGMTVAGFLRRELGEGEPGIIRLRERFADKAALHAAGARLHLQSDAGVRLTPIDRPDLALRTAQVGTGLPLLELIAAMTSVAATAVGLDAEVGVLRPGARADLLIVGGDPTEDAAALRQVREVWRDGRRVVWADDEAGLLRVAA